MPDTPSITIVKRFTYRGQLEEWGNTYHFAGTTPTTDAAWLALGEAIYASERACITSAHNLVKLYGYAAGNEHSVYQKDYVADGGVGPAGQLALNTNDRPFSGDQAGWIRAKIGINSKGRKVYIRKYFHGGAVSLAAPDAITNVTKAGYDAHLAKLLDGTLPGGFKWAGPQAQVASVPTSCTYVTTRTLKRRGKRP